MEREGFGKAELEEWIVFYKGKGFDKWGGVVHLRLCLKELIRGWGIVFGMVLRRRR